MNLFCKNIGLNRIIAATTIVAAIFCVLLAVPAQAKFNDKLQNRPYADLKRWHLGFSVGLVSQDLGFTHNGLVTPEGEQWYVETPSFNPGIAVQVLGDLRLHQYFNLRFSPGMAFTFADVTMRDYVSTRTLRQSMKNVYVILPIDLKISGDRLRNARPYVTAGVMPAFSVGKRSTEYLQLKTTDCYLSVGIGCDFYLPFFKFNPEIRFCFGLADILNHNRPDLEDDPETFKITQSLKKVKSNMFMITFYFE